MGRSRAANPDLAVDADRGASLDASTKVAEVVTPGELADRAVTRSSARDLDRTVESMPGLSRQQRDRERAMPRDMSTVAANPRMDRDLPAAEQVRMPLSSRQRKARSRDKRQVQDRLPATQHAAVAALIGEESTWGQLNDALSAHVGDAQQLDDDQLRQVQRIDRAVQAYETRNPRQHVVYTNVRMPDGVTASSLGGFVRQSFRPGTEVAFDRYTMGAHSLHELEVHGTVVDGQSAERTAVFEISTRRGMYLGRSDSLDDTSHLLPRGLRLRVASTHAAPYARPDGSTGTRQVVQLVDLSANDEGTS